MNFNLEQWVLKVNEYISENFSNKKGPFIILVAGGTASWKTSRVANKIQETFVDSCVISMDNYYRGHTFMNEQKSQWNELNWDQPESLNLELFSEHLSELKSGNTVLAPEYDFKTDPVFEIIIFPPPVPISWVISWVSVPIMILSDNEFWFPGLVGPSSEQANKQKIINRKNKYL